jgi:hypothetical protein
MFGPLIKMGEFRVFFTIVSFVSMLVLQWWFCNIFGFGDFGDFAKLLD